MTTTFPGYRRPNGSVGVRNHVLVLPSVMCANHVVDRIGRALPELVTVAHPIGCGQVGADFEQTKRTMTGFASNPNVAAVLVVGLGCESNESKALAAEIAARGQRVEVIGIQETGDSSATIARGAEIARGLLSEVANYERSTCALSELALATESDRVEDVAADPLLEHAADRLAAAGARVMDAPGQDVERMTAMVAGGAQVVVFATGRGTPTGSPIAPVIKVATDSAMFARMRENMDLDAGTIAAGTRTIEQVGEELVDWVLAAAGGRQTAAEVLGFHDFAIARIGPSF
ncbi:MAG TPA: UxaA family hydrolase [Candidatus Sulfotelmatobacter sp.]|nr:UxaA family hydrolase [Candidatus Sulfotelmatobacter sp.]